MKTALKSDYYLSKIKPYFNNIEGKIALSIGILFIILIITIITFAFSDWDMILNNAAYRKQVFTDSCVYWSSFLGIALLWGIFSSLLTVIFDTPTSYRGKHYSSPSESKGFLLALLTFPFVLIKLIYFTMMYIFYRTRGI